MLCLLCSFTHEMYYQAPDEQQSLYQYQNEWLCKSCLPTIFAIDNIVIDKDFLAGNSVT